MKFKAGAEHPKVKALAEAKEQVLELIASGADPKAAMGVVGKKPDNLKNWVYHDKDFAGKLKKAKLEGEKAFSKEHGRAKDKIDFVKFSETFLGNRVFDHQQDWIDLLEGNEPRWLHPSMVYDQADKNRVLINVPPEHAKSTTITVNYSTYRIAMDPNVRIIVVSKTLIKAREFVYAIKQRLSHPRWSKLQALYAPPGGWKQDADTWRVDTVYLGNEARDSSEKDPTLQALGMGGQIYGARADLIILDDVITTANAHEWEKQIDWLQKEVITRLGKNGKLLVVGTRIAANDLYRELRNPKHWSGGRSPFTYLGMPAVLEYAPDPKDWVTLWSRADIPWDGDEDTPDADGLYPKWDGPALFRRRSEVTPSTWAMVYQQQDIKEDSIFSPICVQGSVNGQRRAGVLKTGERGHPERGDFYTIMGLDPAMTGHTAAVMYSVDRKTGKRYVLDVIDMADPTPGKITDLIKEWVQKYRFQELRVEINAFQKAFALDENLRGYLAGQGIQFREHFTGKNKWDTSFGVAGMAALFGTERDGKHQGDNLIELPSSDRSEGIKSLINQLITWHPESRRNRTDCVMALWFCELRAKELLSMMNFSTTHTFNKYATRRTLGSQGVVNLDDLAYELQTERILI